MDEAASFRFFFAVALKPCLAIKSNPHPVSMIQRSGSPALESACFAFLADVAVGNPVATTLLLDQGSKVAQSAGSYGISSTGPQEWE